MGQTVYVDLFFMINFSMDFLCFYLAFALLGTRQALVRSIVASVLGGIYACVALFLPLGSIGAVVLDIAVCALMCLVAFGRVRGIFKHTCVYIATSAVLGGFMTALFSLLNRLDLPLGEFEGDGFSAWVLALLAFLGGCLTLLGSKGLRRRTAIREAEVRIELDGKSVTLTALCDSGNLLREPISGKPCIIADTDALDRLLPPSISRAAKNGADISRLEAELARRARLIPCASATGERLLLGIRVDGIYINAGKESKRVDAILALSELDGVSVLLPTEIL